MRDLFFQSNSDAANAVNPLYYHLIEAVNDNKVVNTIGDYNINTDSIFRLPVYITDAVADIISDYPADAGQNISGRLYDLFYKAYCKYIAIKKEYDFLPHFFFKGIFLTPGIIKSYYKTYSFFFQFRDEIELGGDIILIGLREQFDEDYYNLIKY